MEVMEGGAGVVVKVVIEDTHTYTQTQGREWEDAKWRLLFNAFGLLSLLHSNPRHSPTTYFHLHPPFHPVTKAFTVIKALVHII